jgi:putative transposase
MVAMKLVVQAQLLPDPDQDRKLRAVVGQFNAAANFAAGVAFAGRTANVYEVRKLAYAEVRERFGLSSQMAQLAIKAACDAYRRDKDVGSSVFKCKTGRKGPSGHWPSDGSA